MNKFAYTELEAFLSHATYFYQYFLESLSLLYALSFFNPLLFLSFHTLITIAMRIANINHREPIFSAVLFDNVAF